MSVLLSTSTLAQAEAAPVILHSPNNEVTLQFEVRDTAGPASGMFYRAGYKGREVVAPSRLGLKLQNAAPLSRMEVQRVTQQEFSSTWATLYGERNRIPDNYRQAIIGLQEKDAPAPPTGFACLE